MNNKARAFSKSPRSAALRSGRPLTTIAERIQRERVAATKPRKTRHIGARVDPALLDAVRRRIGDIGDSEMIEKALTLLASADDFALRLLALEGTVPESVRFDE